MNILKTIAGIVVIFLGVVGFLNMTQDYTLSEEAQWAIGKREFMKGCEPAKTGEAYCNCTFNYLKSQLTIKEMEQAGLDIDKGIIDDVFYEAVDFCESIQSA